MLGGRYRLEEPIGRGAMGEVWRAMHVALGTPLALKLVPLSDGPDGDAIGHRFRVEAQAAARIESRHAVRIIDYGVDGTLAYLAMELLQGETLADRIARDGRLSPGRVSSIVCEIARALGKAHKLGLIHRDIKPQNIFLANVDGEEVAKILDFGIVKSMYQTLDLVKTSADVLVGTPAYMSPEQTMGNRELTPQSDQWQLAVVAFEAICGVRPFRGEGLSELFISICSNPAPTPTQLAPWLPPAFDGWFLRAVQRVPEARFRTADEMAATLAAAIPPERAAGVLRSAGSVLPPAPILSTTTGLSSSSSSDDPRRRRFHLGIIAGSVFGATLGGTVLIALLKQDPPPEPPTVAAPGPPKPAPPTPAPPPNRASPPSTTGGGLGLPPPTSAKPESSAAPDTSASSETDPPTAPQSPKVVRPQDILGI